MQTLLVSAIAAAGLIEVTAILNCGCLAEILVFVASLFDFLHYLGNCLNAGKCGILFWQALAATVKGAISLVSCLIVI